MGPCAAYASDAARGVVVAADLRRRLYRRIAARSTPPLAPSAASVRVAGATRSVSMRAGVAGMALAPDREVGLSGLNEVVLKVLLLTVLFFVCFRSCCKSCT